MARTQVYNCRCGTALARERVRRADRTQMGPVMISFVCDCTPGTNLTMSYEYSGLTIDALLGSMSLPWVSPITPLALAEDDPSLVLFRWELDQIKDWDELIEWLELTA